MLSRSCLPAQEEPILNHTSYCHPLIKLNNSFCEHYGFKLDIYVNVSVNYQQFWNDRLWSSQKQYQELIQPQFRTVPQECIHQARYFGCYFTFPSCDHTTSVFVPKKICKESCIGFFNECATFLKLWMEVYLSRHPDKAALFSCLEQPSRNAGDSPECVDYDRRERLEKEGMFVSWFISLLVVLFVPHCFVCLFLL